MSLPAETVFALLVAKFVMGTKIAGMDPTRLGVDIIHILSVSVIERFKLKITN